MSALLLWLEGPLQSWGADSRYGNRTTLPFPTRSGVLGLLCCAAGRGGEQREWLADMAAHTQTVRAYARRPARGMAAAPPLLTDFQMVGSGYDDGDAWQNLMVPKTSEGKKPVGSGAKMTSRHYVQDMAFACGSSRKVIASAICDLSSLEICQNDSMPRLWKPGMTNGKKSLR